MTKDENLHLLVVEESSSDAESLANELRNAGHSIVLSFAADAAALEKQLTAKTPDILICGSGAGLPDAATVRQTLDRHAPATPLIAIGETASEDQVVDARKAGITALVSYDRPDHLRLVFDHEVQCIMLQHKLDRFSARLKSSEKRAHALIENSSDAIAYIHDGMHVYANRPYLDLFEVPTLDDVEGLPVLDMISSAQRDTFRDFLRHYDDTASDDNTLNIDCISPKGDNFNSTMEFSPATMDGEACTQILIRVNTGDNSKLQKKIKTMSRQDMLTGLWNRQYFMQILDSQISNGSRGGPQRALVYVTIDNFKVIREEAGIAASDLVLSDIADMLRKDLSEKDLLSRFGDYSFVLLKQDTDMDSLKTTCEALLRDIAGHSTEIEGRTYTMTASIGICEINRHTTNAQKIISFADMACEVARTSGGNQIHTHSTVVDESIESDMEKDGDLIIRETIDNERFYLVFQPIVSLKGDRSEQYEVLLRITDAAGNVILPGQFVSIAERSGMGGEIDHWVINSALARLAEYDQDKNATFFIKVTGTSLANPDFADWVSSKLQEHGVDGESVVFEINERSVISNLNQAAGFVTKMRALNCRTAIEHFGISAQSMQVMSRVPADIIKIDGTLIGGITRDKETQEKVRSVAEAVREHEKICIAERLDDAGALALLWQYRVDYIQGFFVQEPARELGYEFESEIV